MEEQKIYEYSQPKKTYYQKNKIHYKKGGKYYTYVSIQDRVSDIKLEVKKGTFLISFN
tara:strand:- start:7 stop:180 length:174 start_codon:yes stop_codon:yes gene_type:complete